MSQSVAVLINNSDDLSQLCNSPSSSFGSYIEYETSTEENVLTKSTVKDADKMLIFNQEDEERQINQFSEDKVLMKEINRCGMKTVKELENWLQKNCNSPLHAPLNLQSPLHTNMETYLINQVAEKFVDNDLLRSDLDLTFTNLSNDSETIFGESNIEENLLSLPELQLDNLGQLLQPTDISFKYKIMPIKGDSFCNNDRPNSADLSLRLQNIINSISDNNEICESIIAQNEIFESNIDDLQYDQTDNLYLSCISTSIFDSATDNVPNNVKLDNNNKSTNFENNNVESLEEDYENLIQCHKIKIGSKTTAENSLNVKNKLQSSIIEKKSKILNKEVLTDQITTKGVSNTANKENLTSAEQSFKNNVQSLRSSKRIKIKLHIDSCECYPNKENITCSNISQDSNYQETVNISKINPLRCRRTRQNINRSCSKEDDTFITESENLEWLKTIKKLKKVGIQSTKFKCFRNDEDKKVWQCDLKDCSQIFKKPAHLRVHMMSHFNIKPFKCDYKNCSSAFNEKTQLDRHYRTHLKRSDYPCTKPNCNKRFTTAGNLAAHEKLHVKRTENCKAVECIIKSSQVGKNTIKSQERRVTPYSCDFEGCEKRFTNRQSASWHKRVHRHPRDLKCSWEGCGKEFKSWNLLKIHKIVHTDERPFACSFKGCKWAFPTRSKLNRHRKMHTNDRRYFCDYEECDKAFLRAEHLNAHKISHTGKRLFKCNICSSNLATKASLCAHLKKHELAEIRKKRDAKKDNVENEVVVCSRVQPMRVVAHRMKKKMRKAKTYAELEKEDEAEEADGKLSENIEKVLDLQGQTIHTMYVCPVEDCSQLHLSKSDLKLHLHDIHHLPLSKIQDDNFVCVVVSSPAIEDNNSRNDNESNENVGKSIENDDIIDVESNEKSQKENDFLVQEFDVVLDVINIDGNQIMLSNDLPFACL